MSSKWNFIGLSSDFVDSAYKTRAENLSRNSCFFSELPASDDEECAFTCLSRATGGVWHDLSRVANLPEDFDAAFFSSDIFYLCLGKVRFRLVLSLRYAPLFAPRPVIAVIVAPRRNGHFARQMRLPVTLIRDALRHVLAQEEVVARCQAVACHVYTRRLRGKWWEYGRAGGLVIVARNGILAKEIYHNVVIEYRLFCKWLNFSTLK